MAEREKLIELKDLQISFGNGKIHSTKYLLSSFSASEAFL